MKRFILIAILTALFGFCTMSTYAGENTNQPVKHSKKENNKKNLKKHNKKNKKNKKHNHKKHHHKHMKHKKAAK